MGSWDRVGRAGSIPLGRQRRVWGREDSSPGRTAKNDRQARAGSLERPPIGERSCATPRLFAFGCEVRVLPGLERLRTVVPPSGRRYALRLIAGWAGAPTPGHRVRAYWRSLLWLIRPLPSKSVHERLRPNPCRVGICHGSADRDRRVTRSPGHQVTSQGVGSRTSDVGRRTSGIGNRESAICHRESERVDAE